MAWRAPSAAEVRRRQGWWSHLFGASETYPDNRPDDNANGVADYPDEVGVK